MASGSAFPVKNSYNVSCLHPQRDGGLKGQQVVRKWISMFGMGVGVHLNGDLCFNNCVLVAKILQLGGLAL